MKNFIAPIYFGLFGLIGFKNGYNGMFVEYKYINNKCVKQLGTKNELATVNIFNGLTNSLLYIIPFFQPSIVYHGVCRIEKKVRNIPLEIDDYVW